MGTDRFQAGEDDCAAKAGSLAVGEDPDGPEGYDPLGSPISVHIHSTVERVGHYPVVLDRYIRSEVAPIFT